MDLDKISGGISAGLGVASDAFNLFTQNSRNKRNQRFTAEENRKNREFQERMYDKAFANNLEQWHRQNAYDSPAQQIARMRQAGVNPDLMYGGGVGNMSSAAMSMPSSPSGSSGSAGNPHMPMQQMQRDPYFNASVDLMRAQAENIRADTEKKGSEKTGIDIQNAVEQMLKDGRLTLQGLEIQLAQGAIRGQNLRNDFDDQSFQDRLNQIEETMKLTRERRLNVEADTENKYAQWHSLRANAKYDACRASFASRMFESQIRKLMADTNLSYANARVALSQAVLNEAIDPSDIRELHHANAMNANWQTHLNKANLGYINEQTKYMIKANSWIDTKNAVDVGSKVLDKAMDVGGFIMTRGASRTFSNFGYKGGYDFFGGRN